MIESGTWTPGVSAEEWRLPPHTALRVELPDPALAPYIHSYHVFDSECPAGLEATDWELPSAPAIRFVLANAPISTVIGPRSFVLSEATLWGATSRAKKWTISRGGVTVGALLTPLGWAALFRAPASTVRDRVVPLDTMLPAEPIAEVVAALRASDQGPDVKAILDRFLSERLGVPVRDEAEIRAVTRLLSAREPQWLGAAAEAIGMPPHRLRRIAERYFGFAPKTLQTRSRFLRVFTGMLLSGQTDYGQLPDVYFDTSHFLRDGHRFLGMTPRRFLAMDTPYLCAGLRATASVLRAGRADASNGGEDPGRAAA